MAQTDWILRMIEQLGAALIALRNMILGGKVGREEVQSRLQKAVEGIGFNLDLAKAASPETVRMLVAPTGAVEPGRCWLVHRLAPLHQSISPISLPARAASSSTATTRTTGPVVASPGQAT